MRSPSIEALAMTAETLSLPITESVAHPMQDEARDKASFPVLEVPLHANTVIYRKSNGKRGS